ncbi:MAG: RNA polymerase sigma factor [Bacteroidota bacterium]
MIDESVLIQRTRDGDLSAFRHIVEEYKMMVYRLALDMTGNADDADDISQDVFLRAYRSFASFRGEAKLNSWLYRITVNVCLDHRSNKNAKRTELRADMESEEHESLDKNEVAGPDSAAESRVIQGHISKALEVLTTRERSVFVLRHYNDMSLNEIAATLAVTVGTVKSTLFRAVEKLQKELSFYRRELGLEER